MLSSNSSPRPKSTPSFESTPRPTSTPSFESTPRPKSTPRFESTPRPKFTTSFESTSRSEFNAEVDNLCLQIEMGNLTRTTAALSAGAFINGHSRSGVTPLASAVLSQRVEIAQYLLQN